MYSPALREDLIPLVYQAAKEDGIHMTVWVNRVVEAALKARETARLPPENPAPRPCPQKEGPSSTRTE